MNHSKTGGFTRTPGKWHQQGAYVVSDRYEQLQVIAKCGGQETEPLNWVGTPADLECLANAQAIADLPNTLAELARLQEINRGLVDLLKLVNGHYNLHFGITNADEGGNFLHDEIRNALERAKETP